MTAAPSSFPHLLAPLTIGPLRLANRVMQLATTNNLDDHGRVGPDQIAFYVERAKGGVGIIVTEGLAAHGARAETPATSLGRGRIAAHSQETLAGLTALASAVHEHGVPIIGQIYHGGRQHYSDAVPLLWGPSALPDPHSGGVPHAMTIDEIRSMIEGFADAAAMLRSAGFDGVEVHAAQGHLIQEFFSPFSNVRTDEYGGSFANRIRLVVEILDEIRRRCGPGFVVGLRMGAEELSPDGIDESMAVEFARRRRRPAAPRPPSPTSPPRPGRRDGPSRRSADAAAASPSRPAAPRAAAPASSPRATPPRLTRRPARL